MQDKYIPIQRIAKLKGLKSTRSIRNNLSKYIYREVKVKGGTSYEILATSLEPELQHKLMDEDKFHPLVPLNNKTASFVTEKAQLTALARVDLIKGFQNFRTRFKTRKEAMQNFLELYNSGLYLKKIYEFIGNVSRGTIDRWIKAYDEMGLDALMPQYRYSKYDEYDCSLDEHMKQVLMKFLLHPNKITISKAISLTRYILENEGCEDIPSESTFRRYANHFKDTKFDVWTLMREGEKALNDKVEPYIERDLSEIEVGDVLVADGHVLNFEVINPFTGKPTRARRKDLTAIWCLEVFENIKYTRLLKILEKTPFKIQYEIISEVLKHKHLRRCCIDGTGLGMQIAETAQSDFGKYRVEAITFTNKVKEELAYNLRTNFEDKTIYIPSAHIIREDLHSVRRVITASNNIRFDAESNENIGHADRFWALALALYACSTNLSPIHIASRVTYKMPKLIEGF